MATLTFNDIFESNLINNVVDFSLTDIFIAMVLAFIIGLFIFFVYKKTFSGVMYSSGFGVSLMAMALVTTMIIIAISSNLILSLGMVGALSIVRFRSAVKEPMDIAYLFWAISAGIVIGAGLIPLAVFGSAFIGLILIIFASKKPLDKPYILVVDINGDDVEKEVMEIIKTSVKKHVLRSKTLSEGNTELTIEVRLTDSESEFLNKISKTDGVGSAVLVSYNGEYVT
ncbi:DUF4956 domain-containing protein [Methanimicrococcus blatticola]|uniref:Putative membrane protein YhiD involved in acid resistance n=1 Tax=Methanimicrococcus blatticola TaxID=91560 RepID=A0A484F5X0_9EURY|nr:DUF4956 domain-containing protein [Methanimicrococcus blatticola]MBZ3935611.1 DUF4956 domain-containing protein [Methanimicrococcus blatticola]MCC2509252.1 DUF4956 domain-containing protein [Methanimicrococcus blatticola]TDQ69382.1 putative membrane protein YhiD involved in acid resistance [Methanimicrococcus blatticola]